MEKTKSALVSIVIPTYSRNDTLVRAIESALNQTYSNIEIIVVDDNPSDSEWRNKTEKLMDRFADESRIHYHKNKKNLGGAGARNEGIAIARGEYIAFLDDDDEYLPENVQQKMNAFNSANNDKLALVYGFSEYINHGQAVYWKKVNHNGCCLYEAMRENCIAATSQWVARKSALEEVGLFSVVPSKQDSQLILKLLVAGFEVLCVPEVLTRYYMDAETLTHISTNGRKPLQGELLYQKACRKQYDQLDTEQIIEVEYSFALNLFEKYTAVKERKHARQEKKRMYRLFPIRAMKYFIRLKLRKTKMLIYKRS